VSAFEARVVADRLDELGRAVDRRARVEAPADTTWIGHELANRTPAARALTESRSARNEVERDTLDHLTVTNHAGVTT
jgi:hypothetical protein